MREETLASSLLITQMKRLELSLRVSAQMRSQLLLSTFDQNSHDLLSVDQERVRYCVQGIWPKLARVVIHLHRDAALVAIGGGDLDTEHFPVPHVFSLVSG